MKFKGFGSVFLLAAATILISFTLSHSSDEKVLIGLNAEIGHLTSTSDDAIRQGIEIAIDEINSNGGVLGGRKLELVLKDNRAIPARAIANNKELAAMKDLVAVYCGKFSSAVIESLPVIHELGLPFLDPWAANDKVIDNGFKPNFAFRLSLKDEWAVPAMFGNVGKRGFKKVGVLLVNTSWGRNNLEVMKKYLEKHPDFQLTEVQWFNYGDKSLLSGYEAIRKSGAQALLLVSIEPEAAVLVKEVAALPKDRKLPIVSHWAIAGGDFPALCGEALSKVDLVFVQTFDLHTNKGPRAQKLLAAAQRILKIKDFSEIKSPCGLAHAYDLTHILALAIDKAGSTDRKKIRDALEQLPEYDGLIRKYSPPFTEARHEALGPENIIMARYGIDGLIHRGE